MVVGAPLAHVLALLLVGSTSPTGAVTIALRGLLGGGSALAGASDAKGNSYCVGGKLLPEFYVLGAKNTATSSLFSDLNVRGVLPAPGTSSIKEWQFFQRETLFPAKVQQVSWLLSLPDCPANRTVMADFSVTNLFTVPLPSDFAWSEEVGYPARKDVSSKNFDTARLIRQFHADAGTMPKFVVMLREPLARVQSEYYHTLPLHNCNGCKVHDSFVDSFASNVALLQQQPPLMSDWFWKSFYSRQIEEYLKYHDAKNFFFVPDKEYFAFHPQNFSASILSWLRIESEPWLEAAHSNSHVKPHLDEELPPGALSRVQYESFMAPEKERLIRTLTRAHLRGAVLAGYDGLPGDVAAVGKWLERGW